MLTENFDAAVAVGRLVNRQAPRHAKSFLSVRFKTADVRLIAGLDHPDYEHMAVLPEAVRAALAEDFD